MSKGCLLLTHRNGDTVTLEELWRQFLEKCPLYPLKYKVYVFFRNQRYLAISHALSRQSYLSQSVCFSFVVKPGLHYGVDFTVYRSTPTHCHSEICVSVVDGVADGQTCRGVVGEGAGVAQCPDELSWRHVSTLTRVMPVSVRGSFLLCFV